MFYFYTSYLKKIITKGIAFNPLSPADPCYKVASVSRWDG